MRSTRIATLAAAIAAGSALAAAGELQEPFRINTADGPLNVGEIGHAAPHLTDWDGDGNQDLLVGIFGDKGQGKVKIYRNTGSNTAPEYSGPEWFMASGAIGTVPVG